MCVPIGPLFGAARYIIRPLFFNKEYMTDPIFLDWYIRPIFFFSKKKTRQIDKDESTRKKIVT